MNRLKQHLTVANVLSCMALFVALSASAYAAKATLAKNQVKAKNIAKEAVTSPKLKNSGVISAKLATNSVIASKIANGAVTSGKIANGAVRSAQLGGSVVTEAKLKNAAVSASKVSPTLLAQLVKNIAYENSSSVENGEPNKTAGVNCPTGKQAIAGGVRLGGELANVAVTGSYPISNGTLRTGWEAIAHETGGGPYGDWSITAFAICAEL